MGIIPDGGRGNVDIEVTATHENFVVCLVLDASAFERIVQSLSLIHI